MTENEGYRIPHFLGYGDSAQDGQLRMEFSINLLVKMMLAVQGASVDYSTLDVISGHAANFHYDRSRFWVYDISPEEPVSTALGHLGWSHRVYRPQDVDDAVRFTRDHVMQDKPVLARWMEPIVFYGLDRGYEEKLVYYSPAFAPEGQAMSAVELEMKWWKWTDAPDANSLTIMGERDCLPTDVVELAKLCTRRTVEKANCGSVMGSPAGLVAYRAYRDDLDDLAVDFVGEGAMQWGCFAIYQQWTSRRSSKQYFHRIAPLFGGKERQHFEKASTYYEYCLDAWLDWEKYLGRNWELIDDPAVSKESELKDFYNRWRNRDCRKQGARAVDQALKWEEKAIGELKKVAW
jgi:hypothetical protein